MQQPRRTILLVRPYDQAVEFTTAFLARTGLDVAIIPSPILNIEPVLPLPKPESCKALVFTSANGVRVYAGSREGRGMRAFCVGDTTARAADRAGFHSLSAEGDAEALLALLGAHYHEGDPPYLYLHGETQAVDLAARLRERGIPVRARMIYRQVERPLSDRAKEVLASRDVIVPLFSENSARIFARQLRGLPHKRVQAVCMSRTVARALAEFRPQDIHVAAYPSRDGMINAIADKVLGQ